MELLLSYQYTVVLLQMLLPAQEDAVSHALTDSGLRPPSKKSPSPTIVGSSLTSCLPAILWLNTAPESQAAVCPTHVTFQTNSVW